MMYQQYKGHTGGSALKKMVFVGSELLEIGPSADSLPEVPNKRLERMPSALQTEWIQHRSRVDDSTKSPKPQLLNAQPDPEPQLYCHFFIPSLAGAAARKFSVYDETLEIFLFQSIRLSV